MIKRKSEKIYSGSFEIGKSEEAYESKQPKPERLWFNFRLIFYSALFITSMVMIILIAFLHHSESDDWIFPVFTILIIVIIIAITVTINIIIKKQRNQTNQRTKIIAVWAKKKGFKFRCTTDFGMANRYPFNCFEGPAFCTNIIEGTFSGRQICTFDFLRDIDEMLKDSEKGDPIGDDIAGKHVLSALIIESSIQFQRFQPLCIRPESFIDKAVESIGLEDIPFESIEFNSEFHVKAKDRRWAYDAINQATMELLLASPRFNIEFQYNYVIAYRNTPFTTVDIEDALKLLTIILDNLPNSRT